MSRRFSLWLMDNFNYKPIFFPKGKQLFEPNYKNIDIHVINDGLIGLYNYQNNGKKTLLRIKSKGDLMGYRHLFEGDYSNIIAKALTPVCLFQFHFYDKKDFLEKNQKAFQYLAEAFINELNIIENRLAQKSSYNADILVAHCLLDFFSVAPHYHWKHREIAEYCGIEVETVFRILKKFVDYGLIKPKNRKIEIYSLEKLKTFCKKAQIASSSI